MIENLGGELLDTVVLLGLVAITIATGVWLLASSDARHGTTTARRVLRRVLLLGAGAALLGVVAAVQVMTARVAPMSLTATLVVVVVGVLVVQVVADGVPAAVRAMLLAATVLIFLGTLVFLRLGIAPSPARFAAALVLFAVFSRRAVLRLLLHPALRLVSMSAALVCFVLPLVLGPATGGAHIRVVLPVLGAVQTQDLGRVLLVVWLADSLASRRAVIVGTDRRYAGVPVPAVRLVVVAVLPALAAVAVGVLSSDFGPALVVTMVTLLMLAVAGAGRRYFVSAATLGVLALGAVYLAVAKIRVRVDQMTEPFPAGTTDLPHTGKNLLALAHGGTSGLGLGRGMPALVPQARTDSVLAALGHELGALGVVCVLALVLVVAGAAFVAARRAPNDADQLLLCGLGGLVLCQALVVAGGVLTVIPFTGMPVPFFSTSGSSLLAFAAGLGLMVAVARGTSSQPVAAPGPARRLSRAGWTAVVLVVVVAGAALRPALGSADVLAQAAGRDPLQRRIDMLNRGRIVTQDGKVLAVTRVRTAEDRFRPATLVRSYPGGASYGAVVGHVSVSGAATGLEEVLGERLRCQDSKRITGNACPTVEVTLHSRIQAVAAEAIAGRTGAVIAVDLRTGDVLAYVSGPEPDPAPYGDPTAYPPAADGVDRVTGTTTTPGSVAKVAVAVAAQDDDVALLTEPTTSYAVGGGAIGSYDGLPCGGTGIADALARSCNPEFAHVGEQLRADGLAAATGPLLDEQDSLDGLPVAPSRLVGPGDGDFLAAAGAIGLGNAQATPFAITQVTALVARGGRPLHLRLLADAPEREPSTSPVAEDVVAVVQDGMRRAVEDGTARNVPGLRELRAAAKTGTADFAPGRNNAWFTAYAPYDEPRFAVTVLLQPGVERTPELVGARDAGPIAAQVLAACDRWAR